MVYTKRTSTSKTVDALYPDKSYDILRPYILSKMKSVFLPSTKSNLHLTIFYSMTSYFIPIEAITLLYVLNVILEDSYPTFYNFPH